MLNEGVTIQEITNVLDAIAERDRTEGGLGEKEWTQALKEGLCKLAKRIDSNIQVYASQCKCADDGEWLFDLTWCEIKDDYTVSIPLAMESEWLMEEEHLFPDFDKLLVAKADLKLFVFQQESNGVQAMMNNLKEGMKRFRVKIPQETYLLACFDTKRKHFEYDMVGETVSTLNSP